MASLHAFEVAVDLAGRQRDGARQQLHGQQGLLQAAQAQFEQLQGYAQETERRWGLHENARVQPEVMRHHYAFMARLEHAMGLQAKVVQNQELRVMQAQAALRAAELRLASLRKVLEQRRKDGERAQQRREQKETDERASALFARRDNDPLHLMED
ncbi:hypothetical protein GCM10022279_02370 [Comamonas faecalis]|uniref:Flagellar FliJ protein n=1 Tax=Comamonas faecalis TaxID=1387849 RepID=A0ABP7QH55_9BURK